MKDNTRQPWAEMRRVMHTPYYASVMHPKRATLRMRKLGDNIMQRTRDVLTCVNKGQWLFIVQQPTSMRMRPYEYKVITTADRIQEERKRHAKRAARTVQGYRLHAHQREAMQYFQPGELEGL